MNTNEIPADIRAYLDEIAERLWSSHATVMVGAGFSKNARKAIATAPDFPNWHQLADHLYKKLHNHAPDVDTPHYLNPLKLADEVQAAFGRPVLDQMLRTHIPDKEYEPSSLHIRLLELPWVDIFTVNYDTLLERASNKVSGRRFDVVVNKGDLVYSSRPRIIKLHGSFPSSAPFIISEEDYRCYPHEQAPFVNTVQQSLLENTLCLIGFSGDDPNFLHWIGWVRDNLGKDNSPKMYLIGVLSSLTAAQRKLLEDRSVVLVDLSVYPGINSNHAEAFSIVFEYLQSKKPVITVDWKLEHLPGNGTLDEILNIWVENRKLYPNWVVAPESSRKPVFHDLGEYEDLLRKVATATSPSDIKFLYEMNWRLECALCPIIDSLIPHYERILDRYQPFPGSESVGEKAIASQWLDLSLAVLRYYREENVASKWIALSTRLSKVLEFMSPEQRARLYYERCLYSLFTFDLVALKEGLVAWPVNGALPFWEVKRAGLLAELGDIVEAGNILEKALAAIRSNQQLTPVIADFTWVSQESHAMYLLRQVKFQTQFVKFEQVEKHSERWNDLKKYSCDPWNDLELFRIELKNLPASRDRVTRRRSFDINQETVTHHLGGNDSAALLGYTFLRYCEEVGLPFCFSSVNIAQGQAKNAAEQISRYSSNWAIVTLLRTGKSEMAESLFGRDALARMTVESIDQQIGHFIGILRNASSVIAEGGRFSDKNLGVRIASVIPEILSRLCARCSPVQSQRIFELVRELYGSQVRLNYDGVDHLAKRIFRYWSKKEKCAHLNELLELPILGGTDPLERMNFPEPFIYLNLTGDDIRKFGVQPVPKSTIDALLLRAASSNLAEHSRACIRLACLYDGGLLDDNQSAAFGRFLWAQVGPDGFPRSQTFNRWYYLKLPRLAEIDVVGRFKLYVKNASFLSIDTDYSGGIVVSGTNRPSVRITNGNIPLCTDILEATRGPEGGEEFIDWSPTEAVELLNKLIEWWDAGKNNLSQPASPFTDIPAEFRARYNNLVDIVAKAVIPRLLSGVSADVKERLKQLLDELESCGVCILQARAAAIKMFPGEQDGIVRDLNAMLIEGGEDRVVPVLKAIRILEMLDLAENPTLHFPLAVLAQQIKWRREPWLVGAMDIIAILAVQRPDSLSPNILDDVYAGLGALEGESKPLDSDSTADTPTRLNWRAHAAGLAYRLFERSRKMGVARAAAVLRWQAICSDPEEFAEIRNEWG